MEIAKEMRFVFFDKGGTQRDSAGRVHFVFQGVGFFFSE